MALVHRRQSASEDMSSSFDWTLPAWWPRFNDFFRDAAGRQMLRVEEFQEADTLVIRAEMPGIDPDKDVDVTVSDHTVTIRAQRREQEETTDRKFHRKEFSYGAMYRTLTLPDAVNEADVKATYKDGILEVRVPVPEQIQTELKHVPVSRA